MDAEVMSWNGPWVWVCPEEKGGIRWYSETLWKELAPHAPSGSKLLVQPTVEQITALKPSLIHVQHEYGCFGSKVPGKYQFPSWLKEIRAELPQARIVA